MQNRRNRILAAFLCIFAAPFTAVSADILFLPFTVSGAPDPALVEPSTLSAELSQAARFLFQTQKSYPVRSERATKRTLAARGLAAFWRGGLSSEAARRVCRSLDAEYLVSGHAHFEAARRVRLQVRLFGCGAESMLARPEATESWNDLQPALTKLLREATGFAPDRPGAGLQAKPLQGPIVVLLDASGSMRANLEPIRRGIISLLAGKSGGGPLLVFAVRGGEPPKRYGPFLEREAAARELAHLRAAGETTLREMAAGLTVSLREARDRDTTLLILTDASFSRADRSIYEAQLRSLAGSGIRLRLFEMPGSRLADREATARLAESLSLPDAGVASGLEARYIDGSPETFVALRGRVFRSKQSMSGTIARNSVSLNGLEPISSPGSDERRIALSLSQRQGRRIHSFGEPITGLESAIAGVAASRSASGGIARYSVLVKNRGHAFWIRLQNERDLSALRRVGKRAVYLGLRFVGNRGDIPGMTNHPDFLYVKSQAEVPRLLINEWSHLNRLPPRLVRPDDVWFLLCTVVQLRAGSR